MKRILFIALFSIVTFSISAQSAGKSAEEMSKDALEQGNMKADNNDWQGAYGDYTVAIGYFGKNAAAYYKRGLARQNLKDYRGAIADYSKAIYLNNADGDSYYGRGMCYYLLGMKDKCCFEFTKATENGNNDAYQAIQSYCN